MVPDPSAPPADVDFATLAALVPLRGVRAVDVGCGAGDLVRALAAAGAEAVGVEVSTAQLAAAIDRDPGRVAGYAVGVAEALPFDDASADLVIFMKSLHHVPSAQMPAALREAARIVRAGGAVYVAEPLLSGTFFPLTRLVDDETVARGLAQDAVAGFGLVVEATVEYDTRPSFADFEAFRRLLVGVDPQRAAVIDAAEAELRAAFADHAQIDDITGHHAFVQPMRVQVLRVAPERPRGIRSGTGPHNNRGRSEMAVAHRPETHRATQPDETREFLEGKGKVELSRMSSGDAGLGTFEPGWRWSEHVKPLSGTETCQVEHVGYVLEGRMGLRFDDGTELEVAAGDFFVMPPGHDAWTIGDEACRLLDFGGLEGYATGH